MTQTLGKKIENVFIDLFHGFRETPQSIDRPLFYRGVLKGSFNTKLKMVRVQLKVS